MFPAEFSPLAKRSGEGFETQRNSPKFTFFKRGEVTKAGGDY
jgi:hypothetical protein